MDSVEYSGILGVGILNRIEARVDLRTIILVPGRTSHRLSGQEVERCVLIANHRLLGNVGDGPDHPGSDRTQSFSGNTHPSVETGRRRHPCLGLCGLRARRPSPIVAGVMGKMRGKDSLDVPRGVLVEPAGVGTPGAYVARVASPVYTREETDTLGDLEKRLVRKSGTIGDKYIREVNASYASRGGKELSLQASTSNVARYCVLKILNTSRPLEIGKNVKLGTAEAIVKRPPQGDRVRLPTPGGRRDLGRQGEFE